MHSKAGRQAVEFAIHNMSVILRVIEFMAAIQRSSNKEAQFDGHTLGVATPSPT